MEDPKLYKNMTPEEQLEWITDFSKFSNEKLPLLCTLGDVWEESHIKSMEVGLKLIRAFAFCRDYVEKSLMFRDFSRRVNLMSNYVEKIKREISAGTVVRGSNGQTLAYMHSLQPVSRRRGRPSKEEQEAMPATSAEGNIEMEKAKAIAALTGSTIVAPATEASGAGVCDDAKKEEAARKAAEELAKKAAQPSLFDQAVSATLGDARLHIDQLDWLLSAELREETKKIQGLRAVAANEAEQAKSLAGRNVDAAIIAPHSQAACDATNAYKAIYARIDHELASLYIALLKDEEFGGLKTRLEASGRTIADLKNILLPYYEKMGGEQFATEQAQVIAEANAKVLTPEQQADAEQQKAATAAKAADLHAIRTYMLRKDVKMTPKRLAAMKEKLAQVVAYGEDAAEYEAVILKAEQDLADATQKKAAPKTAKPAADTPTDTAEAPVTTAEEAKTAEPQTPEASADEVPKAEAPAAGVDTNPETNEA